MLARAAALSRSLPVPRLPHLELRPTKRAGVVLLVLALLAGGFLWLRGSSLVGVREVSITGASGPQALEIRKALEAAAQDQTTLAVDAEALRQAVARFPIVDDVKADAELPHGLRLEVVQRQVVATIGGVAVAADGDLLRGAAVRGVPALGVRSTPTGARVTDDKAKDLIALAAAAPPAFRRRIDRVFQGPRGLTARLTNGPAVHFGGLDRVAAKWAAATAVLAAPSSQGATHIDVRFPERPAAGGLEQVTEQEPATGAAAGVPSTTP